jgi:hypothetical protein
MPRTGCPQGYPFVVSTSHRVGIATATHHTAARNSRNPKAIQNLYAPRITAVTSKPHASFLALDVAPQQAYANITALRTRYPGVYGPDGFFDAVNPTTGAIGHRDLVLDQSMIMAALDNALNNRALQRDFARDPVSWAAHTYLSMETMSIAS